jgi:PEGA domain
LALKAEIMKTQIVFVSLLTIPLLLTGCASIVDSGPKTVQINSNPEGAKVTISNRVGKEVSVQTTPATVALERASGPFEGEDYTLHFEAAGYYPYETHVQSSLDGWYWGNIFFGGLIGMGLVDPMTGDMFTLSPRVANCNLIPNQALLTNGQSNSVQTETNSSASNPSSPPTKH